MKIQGRERTRTPPELAWQRIIDPQVIQRCTPGLTRLQETEPDCFAATIELKLPAIRGRFEGTIVFVARQPPDRLQLRVSGKGPPGFVNGEVWLVLEPEGEGTAFAYEADVEVGGQVARLGQRMISGVAKDMGTQFFEAFDRLDQVPEDASAAASPFAAFFSLLWRSIKRALGLS